MAAPSAPPMLSMMITRPLTATTYRGAARGARWGAGGSAAVVQRGAGPGRRSDANDGRCGFGAHLRRACGAFCRSLRRRGVREVGRGTTAPPVAQELTTTNLSYAHAHMDCETPPLKLTQGQQ